MACCYLQTGPISAITVDEFTAGRISSGTTRVHRLRHHDAHLALTTFDNHIYGIIDALFGRDTSVMGGFW
jgi:hypothetical protein